MGAGRGGVGGSGRRRLTITLRPGELVSGGGREECRSASACARQPDRLRPTPTPTRPTGARCDACARLLVRGKLRMEDRLQWRGLHSSPPSCRPGHAFIDERQACIGHMRCTVAHLRAAFSMHRQLLVPPASANPPGRSLLTAPHTVYHVRDRARACGRKPAVVRWQVDPRRTPG